MNEAWKELKQACAQCHRCGLGETRHSLVFGDGAENARIMLIGEGPGEQEDRQGVPFVGPAGKLLDDMLEMIYLDRTKVYIANIVKCRPPHNRDPQVCGAKVLQRMAAAADRTRRSGDHRLPRPHRCNGAHQRPVSHHARARTVVRCQRPPLYGDLPPLRPAARPEQASRDVCRSQDSAARDLCALSGGVSRCLTCGSDAQRRLIFRY